MFDCYFSNNDLRETLSFMIQIQISLLKKYWLVKLKYILLHPRVIVSDMSIELICQKKIELESVNCFASRDVGGWWLSSNLRQSA